MNPNGTFCGKFAQAPSSNNGILIPNNTHFFLITEGTATADYGIDLPGLPYDGQTIFIYNASSYNAIYQHFPVINSNSGAIFVIGGSDWYRINM